VVIEQDVEVDVGDPVGVGDAERRAVEQLAGAMDPAARRRVEPGVQAPDLDAGGPVRVAGEGLDEPGLVARQQDERREALGDVELDDVPDDRVAPDLDERLGDRLGVLAQAGAAPAAQHRDGGAHGENFLEGRTPARCIRKRAAAHSVLKP
jgi:hypothetical protein